MDVMRVAVVGAGPAGIYAADLLVKAEQDFAIEVDVFDQLPAPYGLVRYGVSPDHPRVKGIVTALRAVLDSGAIRFFGNVRYGEHLTLEDLKRHYHAVIFATGAVHDAQLEIPGIDAEGSFGAANFVSWFDGHPDVPRTWPLEATSVAVIGNGNVALDVSRMLVKQADDLLTTELPQNVYDGLKSNPLEELHLFGRRGPSYVKFTPLELRELGEVNGVEIVLDERDFDLDDPYAAEVLAKSKQVIVINRIMGQWRERDYSDTEVKRRLHMHFWSKPVEVMVEDGRVTGLRVERTEPDGAGGAVSTGECETIPVGAIYRAIGYFGSPLEEIPFDAARGVIPNVEGRAINAHGVHEPGIYATGWIKRGPTGLIGATKSDARETVENLLKDHDSWWTPSESSTGAIERLLTDRNVPFTTIEGWHRLDEHEVGLGEAEGRERIKVVPREDMTRISRGE